MIQNAGTRGVGSTWTRGGVDLRWLDHKISCPCICIPAFPAGEFFLWFQGKTWQTAKSRCYNIVIRYLMRGVWCGEAKAQPQNGRYRIPEYVPSLHRSIDLTPPQPRLLLIPGSTSRHAYTYRAKLRRLNLPSLYCRIEPVPFRVDSTN